MRVNNTYVGRFAPSPTGPLHFGSLVAALASYLDAKAHHGSWLLRIEDLDPPRESKSAPAEIIQQLKQFHLHWDGDVSYQSNHLPAYERALGQLAEQNLTFACTCSRKRLPPVYPGTCRHQQATNEPFAIRVKVDAASLLVEDIFLGDRTFNLSEEIGDFIIRRKDGLFAYQLAVVVDDAAAGVTHVIRGVDLLDSTPRQQYLYQKLQLPTPRFGHLPVITGTDGNKLSKQAHAPALDFVDIPNTLNRALMALGQPQVAEDSVPKLLTRAIEQWQRARVPRVAGIPYASLTTMA